MAQIAARRVAFHCTLRRIFSCSSLTLIGCVLSFNGSSVLSNNCLTVCSLFLSLTTPLSTRMLSPLTTVRYNCFLASPLLNPSGISYCHNKTSLPFFSLSGDDWICAFCPNAFSTYSDSQSL